jgi:hypothetical protein
MSNELHVLHKGGELLRTDAGSGRFKRKRSWAFVTESAAKQQAKHHKGSVIVRYVPAIDQTLVQQAIGQTLLQKAKSIAKRATGVDDWEAHSEGVREAFINRAKEEE